MTRRARHTLRILALGMAAITLLIAARALRAAEPTTDAAPALEAAAPARAGTLSLAEVFFIQRNPSTGEVEWIGSLIIWALMLLSAASIALMVSLFRESRRELIVPDGLASRLREILRERRAPYAADVASQSGTLLGEVVRAGLSEAPAGHGAMLRAAESTSEELTLRRLRRAEPLAVIGNVAPMIGLFGTVYGIILAFRAIVSSGGTPDPVSLAAGIGTALVTTFWGLVVAIPALAAYSIIRGRIDSLTLEASRTAEELFGVLRNASGTPRANAANNDKPGPRLADSSMGASA